MKKALIISAIFPPEPVVSAKLSFDIATTLSENNDVTVITPRPSRPFGFQFIGETISLSFKHIQLNSFTFAFSNPIGRLKESCSFGKHCYQYITNNRNNIDVIYANTWPLFGQYFAVKAARKYNIPIIIHVQDIYPESLIQKIPKLKHLIEFLLLTLDKYILRNATHVVTISEKMKNYLAATRNLKQEKIAVVQNWQDEAAFIYYKSPQNSTLDTNRPFTFMYLGNIGPVAGIEILIDAFIEANLPNSRLVIAGSGSMKEKLQGKALELNAISIEFWSVPEGKVPEIQDQANVMLLPIKKGAAGSSIPSKLPAYMFSAKPIIASVDCDCDTAAAIREAGCGWVVEPGSIEKLSEIFKSIANKDKTELVERGQKGFHFALKNFSKQNNLLKLINIIENSAK